MLLYPSIIIGLVSLITPRIVSVFAQSSGNVSAQCQSSLVNIVASPDAQCLNVAGFVPVLLGGSNASVVGPINTWLTGMCPKDACSNQTLAALVNNITRGCSSDFPSLGLSDDNIPSITNSVQRYYPTVRQILCLKDDSTGQLCAVEHLSGIQNATGTVSANNVLSFVPQVITGGLPVLGAPQSMTCHNCTKEAYNIIISNTPEAITSGANSSISGQCGANFIDGKTPAGISQTAAGNSLAKTKTSSGALRSLALSDGLMILIGFGALFAVLV